MRVFVCLAALAALVLSGCGQKKLQVERHAVYPVEGEVIWKEKPLAGAHLEFYPLGWSLYSFTHTPMAVTGKDGRYRVGTYDKEDGAPAGKYAITITCLDPKVIGMYSTSNILPKQYGDPKTSGLEVEIVEGTNALPPLRLTEKAEKSDKADSAKQKPQ
jgi:hypothetical protein